MVVVVMIPDRDRVASVVLAVVGAGVEALVGHQSLVALDLPVVPGGIDPDPLVAADEAAGRAAERLRGVVAAVVGDQPGDLSDAVLGEERQSAMEESDRGRGCLILERLCVGQAGEPVLHGVEVGVADPRFVSPLTGQGLRAAAAAGRPAAASGGSPLCVP